VHGNARLRPASSTSANILSMTASGIYSRDKTFAGRAAAAAAAAAARTSRGTKAWGRRVGAICAPFDSIYVQRC
jgi:hypothetical protein